MDDWMAALRPMFAAAFTAWGSPVTWLEIVAVVIALLMVGCNMRVNPLAWPLAITSSALYGLLFLDSRLYGEAGLQVFFIVMAGWGWWQWLRGRGDDGSALQVRHLGHAGRWRVLLAMALAWPALGLLLATATDSDVPWWDAFPTAGSVIGQWLLARKYVENWLAWGVVNVVSVLLFAYKGLWLTVLLYGLFVVLSVLGWRVWQRLARARAA
jgi:nicotinamide mononucleotide transporter